MIFTVSAFRNIIKWFVRSLWPFITTTARKFCRSAINPGITQIVCHYLILEMGEKITHAQNCWLQANNCKTLFQFCKPREYTSAKIAVCPLLEKFVLTCNIGDNQRYLDLQWHRPNRCRLSLPPRRFEASSGPHQHHQFHPHHYLAEEHWLASQPGGTKTPSKKYFCAHSFCGCRQFKWNHEERFVL